MKKFLSLTLVFLSLSQTVFAFPANTSGWVCNPEHISADAVEIDLKSDLKTDYKLYQTTISNVTKHTLDLTIPSNANADQIVADLLKQGLTLKGLMYVPKQIAVESYKEDVGTGAFAKVHKGLIYVVATGGAAVVGVAMLGIYPQQKLDEYFSHKKIKKEYGKINSKLTNEFTLSPLEQKEVYLMIPTNNSACVINSTSRDDIQETNSDYHQL